MSSQAETKTEAIGLVSPRSVVYDAASLRKGLLMALVMAVALAFYLSPLYRGKTGMQLSEDLFNSLSKGSIYFIPGISEQAEQHVGRPLEISLRADGPDQSVAWGKLFSMAGAAVTVTEQTVRVQGDLGSLVSQVLEDAEAFFANRGAELEEKYGRAAKETMYHWWSALKQVEEMYLRANMVEEASFVTTVLTKAVEPAYNYYGVLPERVAERTGIVALLLGIYIVYALWWGFAIFFLLKGLGIIGANPEQS